MYIYLLSFCLGFPAPEKLNICYDLQSNFTLKIQPHDEFKLTQASTITKRGCPALTPTLTTLSLALPLSCKQDQLNDLAGSEPFTGFIWQDYFSDKSAS